MVIIFSLSLSTAPALSETKKSDGAVNYFVEGIKYRGEGKCEEAVKSYQTARKIKQFKADWEYHLAVADCFVALKRYDAAIDAYTRVIDAAKNKAMQAEMYKGRGRAYYFKAVKADKLDKKYIDLAQKDLQDAKALGADISDVENIMSADMEVKPLDTRATESNQLFSSQQVTIIESQDRIIAGEGEYVMYLSAETVIKDKSGRIIPASEIRPGDSVDFTCLTSYRNRADGMLHCSVQAITLNRDASAKVPTAASGEKNKDDSNAFYIKLINQRLDRIDMDIRELREKQEQNKKEAKPVKKAKIKKKKMKRKRPEVKKQQTALPESQKDATQNPDSQGGPSIKP